MQNEYLENLLDDAQAIETQQQQQPTEQQEKVTFDARQQEKVNDLIRKAQGRAARELREELARVQLELAAVKQTAPQADQGTQMLATELAATKAERDALARERQDTNITEHLRRAAGDQFVNQDLAVNLMRQNVRVVDGKPVVIGPDGNPRMNASLDQMTLQDLATELTVQHPYLARGTVRPGTGSTPASTGVPPVQLDKLFGKGSNAAEINRLALHDPEKFRRLRRQARQEGLIP
jgi:hypothetical protein